MKGNMTNKITTVQQVLPSDFIISKEYTVIKPGLSQFNQDQTITHEELLEYLKDQPLNTIEVLPMCSFDEPPAEKDYELMTAKVRNKIDKLETEMTELIEDYNDKYEDDEKVYEINTCDLSSLFSQLNDFIEDHQ
jgi:hypothetical protein